MVIHEYELGGNAVLYVRNRDGSTGLCVCPADRAVALRGEGLNTESMVQVKFEEDPAFLEFAEGLTLLGSASVHGIAVRSQHRRGDTVRTELADGRGNEYTHVLAYHAAHRVFETYVVYKNNAESTRTLELLSSCSVTGIANLTRPHPTLEGCLLHRLTSFWSAEGRKVTDRFEDLGIEDSWGNQGVRCEKFGQVGSMPVRKYFPFACVEEPSGVCWAFNFEAPYSWQAEVLGIAGCATVAGGLADFLFGHWKKQVRPGEMFCTRRAYFSVGIGFEERCADLAGFFAARLQVPPCEEHMPVLFNEYCTTYGNPEEGHIRRLAQAAKRLGAEYFVIDAGWYKKPGIDWYYSIGDWEESREFFPGGIRALAQDIRALGLVPGIWFEYENCARDSAMYGREEMLLRRGGRPLNSQYRRFLDLRREDVQAYIGEKVFSFLRENGFGYVKVDYNANYGCGCDGAESLGEGGRQVAEASLELFRRLREEVPGIVTENCASGGHRLEPARMQLACMASFSDAHECVEVPVLAANVSRIIPRRQNQIWATLKRSYSARRLYHLLLGNFYGRMCLSGEIDSLSEEQCRVCEECIGFYRECVPILKEGRMVRLDCDLASYRDPKGCQIGEIVLGGERLIIIHTFADARAVEVPLYGEIVRAVGSIPYRICEREGGRFVCCDAQEFGALALRTGGEHEA